MGEMTTLNTVIFPAGEALSADARLSDQVTDRCFQGLGSQRASAAFTWPASCPASRRWRNSSTVDVPDDRSAHRIILILPRRLTHRGRPARDATEVGNTARCGLAGP